MSVHDSRIVLNHSTSSGAIGLEGNSRAEINNSILQGRAGSTGGIALVVGINSRAVVNNSEIIGTAGANVTAGSLDLVNVQIDGGIQTPQPKYGWGLGVFGGEANVMSGSRIRAQRIGVWISPAAPALDVSKSQLNVSASGIESLDGPAIKVESAGIDGDRTADINIANRSVLLAGNGNLLETSGTYTTSFTVDDSDLTGNLVADDISVLNVKLQNGARLTGDIINSTTLAVDSGARWQMTGDGTLKSLSMNGGSIGFAEEGFHKLSLDQLSGTGTFGMRVDLDTGVGDFLNVNGQADGNFGLRVRNTGVEPVSPDMQPLQIVHTEGGDAQFNLIGGRVDLGAYSYLLEQQGNDWFIVGEGKETSPSTNTALALFHATPSIWNSELSTLRTRMGELRHGGASGGWIRAYGNRLDASTRDGVDYRQQQSGLSLGADAPVDIYNGRVLFGVMGGYSKADLDLSHGTKGKVDSYYVGAYGTWLSDDGYYLDGVLKLNRFRNKADVAMSDASKAKGDYANMALGGSVEFGRHIKLTEDYFLEPFAQLSTVVIEGSDYKLDNGLEAKHERSQSVLGKVGTSVGRSIALKDGGIFQPYVKVAFAQEFSRSNDVKVNDKRFDNSLFGSRAEFGAGAAVSLSERVQVHADFDYMKGKRIEQPWGANVGVRFAF
ncbi:autotransporter outer membrane beta-barrel domain-containing protein [Pseudomonas sp. JDS28PS106]|uniref:autotransporter outer membrane beta-barrel domain-containing protein n=1 Tax=Pseudomonas sp. JDS28PS106 TaxID=2497235 RepID=UPI003FA69C1F